jgi:hypothetical protein
MISIRREHAEAEIQGLGERDDLFNQLISARDLEDMLTEDELIGTLAVVRVCFTLILTKRSRKRIYIHDCGA